MFVWYYKDFLRTNRLLNLLSLNFMLTVASSQVLVASFSSGYHPRPTARPSGPIRIWRPLFAVWLPVFWPPSSLGRICTQFFSQFCAMYATFYGDVWFSASSFPQSGVGCRGTLGAGTSSLCSVDLARCSDGSCEDICPKSSSG